MLTSFALTSFRGIDHISLNLGKRTYIQGVNGSGKTHILDAIHLLSGTHPLYGNTTMDFGCIFEGYFLEGGLSKKFCHFRDEKRDIFAVQDSKLTRPKYMRTLPWRTVHISPFDMNLLYFAPGMRRDAIDMILARSYEQFPGVKRNYETIMRQRNALLKRIREGEAQRNDLDFWDIKFAEIAELYLLYRRKFVSFAQDSLSCFPSFFSKYPITFSYQSSIFEHMEPGRTEKEMTIKYLRDNRERDILTGHTHIGPHRDDWGFSIVKGLEHIPVESYLSRGEMKMLLLGLKLIEASFLEKILALPVIMLIDDIFSELDENNSNIFLNSLIKHQIILTSQKPLPNQQKHHDFICINLEYS